MEILKHNSEILDVGYKFLVKGSSFKPFPDTITICEVANNMVLYKYLLQNRLYIKSEELFKSLISRGEAVRVPT